MDLWKKLLQQETFMDGWTVASINADGRRYDITRCLGENKMLVVRGVYRDFDPIDIQKLADWKCTSIRGETVDGW